MYKIYFFSFLLFLPLEIFAYIDPGTGSAIAAAIIAFFSGLYFYFKKFIYFVKHKFNKIFKK